jgi:hypothetical protein
MRGLWLGIVAVAVFCGVAAGVGMGAAGDTTSPSGQYVPAVPEHSDVPCGVPTLVTVPESNDEVTYEGFMTSYGYFKVVATLKDTGRTFALEGTGYRSTPIAPYRAEHLTLVVEPCRDADPVVPILPSETATAEPPEGEPAQSPQPPSGCYP